MKYRTDVQNGTIIKKFVTMNFVSLSGANDINVTRTAQKKNITMHDNNHCIPG